MKHNLIFFSLWLCCLSNVAGAQNKIKTTIRGEAQLPRMLGNRAFTKTFSGVFNGGASINVGGKHFNIGPSYTFSQQQVFPARNTDAHPILSIHTPAVRFSYDKLTETGNGMWSPFVQVGYSFLNYTRINCIKKTPNITQTQALSINLGGTYYMMLDKWTGVGFTVGFNAIDHVYRPENICMDEGTVEYTENQKRGSLKGIFFGFSAYFDLAWQPDGEEE